MLPSVVQYRRALHQIPEIEDRLPKTTAYVLSILDPLNCTVTTPTPGSVCAYFDAGREETVAFRADMDALPLTECADLPYASCHPGFMHACGHDAHTAMALALAEYVSEHLAEVPRNVLIIFQPAEECSGGALPICQTGILQAHRVSRIFGMHVWPNAPAGQILSCPGSMMAQATDVTITVTGKSVHLSRASEGLDALVAGAEFLRQAYTMMKTVPTEEARTLQFGKMISGSARNAVSAETRMEGSLRTYSAEVLRYCHDHLLSIGETLSRQTGCHVDVHLQASHPPVHNHEGLYETVCAELGPAAPILLNFKSLASEDFSCYQQEVPGIFFFFGIGNAPELHAQNFNFDDETALPLGVEFLKKLLMLK